MRVLFVGAGSWATDVLEACCLRYLTAVVTYKRERKLTAAVAFGDPVSTWARKRRLPVHLEEWPPQYRMSVWHEPFDAMVVSNWRHAVPESVLDRFRLGCINIHRGALPEFAGFSPINWAVALGARETKVTAHVMTRILDAGPLLWTEQIPIGPDDTATQVYLKTRETTPNVVARAIGELQTRQITDFPVLPAPERLLPCRTSRSLKIDWNLSSNHIYNLIRAQSPPFPSAFLLYKKRRFYVAQARKASGVPMAPCGQVIEHTASRGAVVSCLGGAVEVGVVRPEGTLEQIQAACAFEVSARLDTEQTIRASKSGNDAEVLA